MTEKKTDAGYVIFNDDNKNDILFWSKEFGWISLDQDVLNFTEEEKANTILPIGGKWGKAFNVVYSATFKTTIVIEDEQQSLQDAVNDIDVPENDNNNYEHDSFEVISIEDSIGQDITDQYDDEDDEDDD